MTYSHSHIYGEVAPGFEAVREAFIENFEMRREIGAACCVYQHGKKVVDLWGGYRNAKTQELWEEDTLVPVFSTAKGISAMVLAFAHSRHWFKYDDPVAKYWPEFGQNGKEEITIRQLLANQAGLCVIDKPLSLEIIDDVNQLADALAVQKPAWKPGKKHGYHGISLGLYEAVLINKVDPKKRTIGELFQQEIVRRLDTEFYFGLPDEIPEERLATIHGYKRWEMMVNLRKMHREFVRAILNPRSLSARTFGNPKMTSLLENYNKRELLRLNNFPTNGVGSVRALAAAYNELVTEGYYLGISNKTLDAIHKPARMPEDGTYDEILKLDSSYAMGFVKPSFAAHFGSSQKAFGRPGVGGSFAFADPDAGISFAYAMNRCGFYLFDDPREWALRNTVYKCIGKPAEATMA